MFVVAVHQEQRSGAADRVEEAPLVGINLIHSGLAELLALDQPVETEIVTQRHVEIRRLLRHVAQSHLVELRVEHLAFPLGMRITLDAKRERAAGGPLCLERAGLLFRRRREEPVVVPRVRRQRPQRKLNRDPRLDWADVRPRGVGSRLRTVLDTRLKRGGRQGAHHDRVVRRPAKDHGQIRCRPNCAVLLREQRDRNRTYKQKRGGCFLSHRPVFQSTSFHSVQLLPAHGGAAADAVVYGGVVGHRS